jgi:hypothetical protein
LPENFCDSVEPPGRGLCYPWLLFETLFALLIDLSPLAVLSYSRKGYSEALYRQDTETFLRCLENGLRSFGGTPLLLNLDNFKAAVRNADWFDPDINPKLADFCRHYGMHVLPCRPGRPEHKGKVERGIAYVRSNALKGRRFKSLSEENRFLSHWESAMSQHSYSSSTLEVPLRRLKSGVVRYAGSHVCFRMF